MATYIKVDKPTAEDKIALQLRSIINRHRELGDRSPMPREFFNRWSERVLMYLDLHDRIEAMRNDLSSLVEQKNELFENKSNRSTRDDQSMKGKVSQMRKLLKVLYQNQEREMLRWGINVTKNEVPSHRLGANAHRKKRKQKGKGGPTAD